jgi:hypothetical protein
MTLYYCFSFQTNLTNLIILQYVESVNGWSAGCEIQAVNSDITILETSIHHHQALYEGMCQAYTEVSRIHHHQALCVRGKVPGLYGG